MDRRIWWHVTSKVAQNNANRCHDLTGITGSGNTNLKTL